VGGGDLGGHGFFPWFVWLGRFLLFVGFLCVGCVEYFRFLLVFCVCGVWNISVSCWSFVWVRRGKNNADNADGAYGAGFARRIFLTLLAIPPGAGRAALLSQTQLKMLAKLF
ncbi:MAG TPA: hypothetical protein O0X18_06170, partial [Methanocorpusculum sp.]|nr:hypothetical protein [Methanocorpusculum sp.]